MFFNVDLIVRAASPMTAESHTGLSLFAIDFLFRCLMVIVMMIGKILNFVSLFHPKNFEIFCRYLLSLLVFKPISNLSSSLEAEETI